MKKNQSLHLFVSCLLFISAMLIFAQPAQAADGDGIVRINGGATDTNSRLVDLDIWAPQGTTQMIVINADQNDRSTYWEYVTPRLEWLVD